MNGPDREVEIRRGKKLPAVGEASMAILLTCSSF